MNKQITENKFFTRKFVPAQGARAPESLQVTERHWYYYDPFYIRRIICSIIPDPVHAVNAGGMDHRQI